MKLNRYHIVFKFLKGKELVIADTLSRAYINEETETRLDIFMVQVNSDLNDSRLQEIREATAKDPDLQELIDTIQSGWPDQKCSVKDSCKPYFDIRDNLSVYEGSVVKGESIVIPKSERQDIKRKLHSSSHSGYDSMLRRARGSVYWPGMNAELKQLASTCEPCQELKPRTTKPLLKQHDDGGTPWTKIGLDLFEIKDKTYLVAIDYYSNFITIDRLHKATSKAVVGILKKLFTLFGIPTTIISDGGSQFTASDFQIFTKKWGITHVRSSPNHPNANGKAESAVKIMKHLILKCEKDGTCQFEALLEQRRYRTKSNRNDVQEKNTHYVTNAEHGKRRG